MINYDDEEKSGGGNKVRVESSVSKDGKRANSTLTVLQAAPSHSGNYTCQPSNAIGASIQVFVSEGESFGSRGAHLVVYGHRKRPSIAPGNGP